MTDDFIASSRMTFQIADFSAYDAQRVAIEAIK